MAILGGLGAISSVGDRFCRLGTQPTKKCLAVARHHFLAVTTLAGFTRLFFEKFAIYWFLEGSGGQKNFAAARGPKRAKTAQKRIFLVLRAVLGETPAEHILITCCHMRTQ